MTSEGDWGHHTSKQSTSRLCDCDRYKRRAKNPKHFIVMQFKENQEAVNKPTAIECNSQFIHPRATKPSPGPVYNNDQTVPVGPGQQRRRRRKGFFHNENTNHPRRSTFGRGVCFGARKASEHPSNSDPYRI